ncbi:MAG: response regulator transcription factor [Verrucomicrobia bacterium]|jgi:two-component system phosphate regulon response regulator PhoB|nr:response regulator transcription factor [Verrucomicrobiota bacterium]MDA7531408.1 response regulator transcription factor [Akkermansiaceae bacterium]MDB4608291.1 response regulator transcription factor [bacterium]MBT7969513.1 response regulator transcription factor [Verrucomicrobiota bacterium]MDA7532192.1 response regulator transcription factor [Akkermansiaceae bacterium]
MESILIIEDEIDIANLVGFNFERNGYSVDIAHDGREGLEKILKNQPDLVILDLMLPEIDGYKILKKMQRDTRSHSIPVIMLTAKSQIDDRLKGLELGADDYITKPFSPKELILRAQAILKRNRVTPVAEDFLLGPFRFDKNALAFFVHDQPLSLSLIEFKLFLFLCQRAGQSQDRNNLLKVVWGYSDEIHSRTLDTHMKRLRKKLGKEGSFIETIRGIGYRVRQPE